MNFQFKSGWIHILVLLILLSFSSIAGIAQKSQSGSVPVGNCTALSQEILLAAQSSCGGIERDQICYGSVSIEASANRDARDFRFDQIGDIARIQDISTLRLQALDPVTQLWGVALLQVEALSEVRGRPASPQSVTLLLFGDVAIQNQGREFTTVPMTATSASNIRLRASGGDTLIVGSVTSGQQVMATGRLVNSNGEEWIRVDFDTSPSGFGWILGTLLTGDRSTLVEVSSSSEPAFGPMQAFTFSSSDDQNECADVSSTGLLIQTPEGSEGEISFFINEVNVQVGSSAYIDIVGNRMRVNNLEGNVTAFSRGFSRIIPRGSRSVILLNANGVADGPPGLPEPYDEDQVNGLGSFFVAELFEENIDLVDPFDESCLDDFNLEFNDGAEDPFGDEVTNSCFLQYYSVFSQEYYDELPDACFDEDGTVFSECLEELYAEFPDQCFDPETGELSELCLDAADLVEALPDGCLDRRGNLQDECVEAFSDIDALPDSCFAEDTGELLPDCMGASGLLFELPDSCYLDGEITDECLESFSSIDDLNEVADTCLDDTGEVRDTCLDDPEWLSYFPEACFDPETDELLDECISSLAEIDEVPDQCVDEETGWIDDSCLAPAIDEDFGYGTVYRDEQGNPVVISTGEGNEAGFSEPVCDPAIDPECDDIAYCDPDIEFCGDPFELYCDPDVEDCEYIDYSDDYESYTCDPEFEYCDDGTQDTTDYGDGDGETCDPDVDPDCY